MINGIIFSKDRAAQLKLFLDSVNKNAKDIFELKVIYTSSNEEFEKGYEKVIEKYPEVKWVKQTDNFKEDVLMCLTNTECEYVTFFTDDDIIYRKVEEQDLVKNLIEDKECFCFSMRLGKNVNWCYAMHCDNILKEDYEDDKFIRWNWSIHYMDFGYPLSVDGHIFRKNEILKLTKKIQFNNPNTFEASLQIFNNFPKKNMWAFNHSVLVNSPSNIVQETFSNLHGQQHAITAKDLNDKFLSGGDIMLDKIDFSDIKGCHQELELPMSEIN
jgi:hypothetical protein